MDQIGRTKLAKNMQRFGASVDYGVRVVFEESVESNNVLAGCGHSLIASCLSYSGTPVTTIAAEFSGSRWKLCLRSPSNRLHFHSVIRPSRVRLLCVSGICDTSNSQ